MNAFLFSFDVLQTLSKWPLWLVQTRGLSKVNRALLHQCLSLSLGEGEIHASLWGFPAMCHLAFQWGVLADGLKSAVFVNLSSVSKPQLPWIWLCCELFTSCF